MNCFRGRHSKKSDREEEYGFESHSLLNKSFRYSESHKPIKIIAEQDKVSVHWEDEILEKKKFTNTRGHEIMWYSIRPNDETVNPRTLIMIQHGYGEHFLWYDNLVKLFVKEGCLVFGYDSEGHGRSGGPRGVLTWQKNQVADIHQSIQLIRTEYRTQPLYVVSFSAGALFTLCALLKYPELFSGAVILAPPIEVCRKYTTTTIKIMICVIQKLYPYHKIKSNFDVSKLTKHEEIKEKILRDPLFWKGDICVFNIGTLLQSIKIISKHMHEIKLPFLILHGEDDRLCLVGGAERLFKEAASEDKQVIIYPGAQHHLLMESDEIRKNVLNDIVNWICKRIKEPIATTILNDNEER